MWRPSDTSDTNGVSVRRGRGGARLASSGWRARKKRRDRAPRKLGPPRRGRCRRHLAYSVTGRTCHKGGTAVPPAYVRRSAAAAPTTRQRAAPLLPDTSSSRPLVPALVKQASTSPPLDTRTNGRGLASAATGRGWAWGWAWRAVTRPSPLPTQQSQPPHCSPAHFLQQRGARSLRRPSASATDTGNRCDRFRGG